MLRCTLPRASGKPRSKPGPGLPPTQEDSHVYLCPCSKRKCNYCRPCWVVGEAGGVDISLGSLPVTQILTALPSSSHC